MFKSLFTLFFCLISNLFFAQKTFTVVLDAGHGGKDTGAISEGVSEKSVTLAVVKKIGASLKAAYGDKIKVIYTRSTDVFIALDERAKIGTKNHADLFVSVHCNSNPSATPYGSETYVLGLHRTADNFEVAKKENSVILLEKDYKVTYQGFDPKSPESVIGLSLLQNAYLDQSIQFASTVQKNLTSIGRTSRGVKQAGFLVLRETATPSVLIEIGFVSNANERKVLSSADGQTNIANAIVKSIKSFKSECDAKNKNVNTKPEEKQDKQTIKSESPIVFKVQLTSSTKSLDIKKNNFTKLKNVKEAKVGANYLYIYGETSSYKEIEKKLKEAKTAGFSQAKIYAIQDGKRITITSAMKK